MSKASGLSELAASVLNACRAAGIMLATAESCTGGMIAAALTDLAGASDVVERGFVTYSNAAKTELLGVGPEGIVAKGAVSAEVAESMARGAIARSHAQIAVSVTGIAGPGGGSETKPVGLVWFGVAFGEEAMTYSVIFPGDRAAIRLQATERALYLLLDRARRLR